jgi:DNA-binding MarR family transcriptional regulator
MAENDNDATLLDEAGRALFHLGRILGRPGERQGTTDGASRAVELSRIMVVQAVEATKAADPDAEIGVGSVAAHLAIDPSTASRLVAETVADGYLTSSPAPADARRRRLDLTPAGVALAAAARRHQHATFAAAMRDWPTAEQQLFARRFIGFAAAIVAAREAEQLPGPPTPD